VTSPARGDQAARTLPTKKPTASPSLAVIRASSTDAVSTSFVAVPVVLAACDTPVMPDRGRDSAGDLVRLLHDRVNAADRRCGLIGDGLRFADLSLDVAGRLCVWLASDFTSDATTAFTRPRPCDHTG
jgi:hypothetical protein